jgi:hypothetical protein
MSIYEDIELDKDGRPLPARSILIFIKKLFWPTMAALTALLGLGIRNLYNTAQHKHIYTIESGNCLDNLNERC